MSEVDFNFVINFNRDLQKRFNNNKNIILNYLNKNGKKENRIFTNEHYFFFHNYDWKKYLDKNKDLKKAKIDNPRKAFMHYIYYGKNEKREAFLIDNKIKENLIKNMKKKIESIDIEDQNKTTNNSEIKNNNTKLLEINSIQNKKNDINKNIQNNEIKNINNIEHNNDNDIKNSENKNEKLEMIFYMFDWNRYLQENPDLINNGIDTNIDAYNHYIKYGKKEGRNIVPKVNLRLNEIYHENDDYISEEENYDPIIKKYDLNIDNKIFNLNKDFYKNINKDSLAEVNTNNELELLNHFINVGILKNLPYSYDHYYLYMNYNWNKYFKYLKNKNIKNIDNSNDAFKYYIFLYENKNHMNEDVNYDFNTNEISKTFFQKIYKLNVNLKDDTFIKLFLLTNDHKKKICTYSNYFIYNLIDWESFKIENKVSKELDSNFKLLNYYLSNLKNIFNLSLKLSLLNDIINNKNIELIFRYLKDFKNSLKKSFFNQNYIFTNNLININDFLIKINNKYNLIDIPKFFEFKHICKYNIYKNNKEENEEEILEDSSLNNNSNLKNENEKYNLKEKDDFEEINKKEDNTEDNTENNTEDNTENNTEDNTENNTEDNTKDNTEDNTENNTEDNTKDNTEEITKDYKNEINNIINNNEENISDIKKNINNIENLVDISNENNISVKTKDEIYKENILDEHEQHIKYMENLYNNLKELEELNNYDYKYCFIVYFKESFEYLKFNLLSIIYQFYKNWKVILIDDSINNENIFLINNLINEYTVKKKFIIHRNKSYLGEGQSKYNILNEIKNNEIIINLNSNCWLINNFVLNTISEKINNSKNLFYYSSCKNYKNNGILNNYISKNYPEEVIRLSQYRSYYNYYFLNFFICFANLYKNIPKNYFLNINKINEICFDINENFCLAELSEGKLENILEILFIKQRTSIPKNLNRKEIENNIRSMNKLKKVIPPIYINQNKNSELNIIDSLNNFNILNYEKINNFNSNYVKYFEKINNETNYDHIIILNSALHIHKNFLEKFILNYKNLLNKDFVYLSFDSNSDNIFEFSTKFENNNLEFKEIKSGNDIIDGLNAFIVSRNFRNLSIELNKEEEFKFNKLIYCLKSINSTSYIENDLTFFITNNIFFINNINVSDKYNMKNKLDLKNFIIE